MFHFFGFIAGCPSGNGLFVNGHDVDARRNYSLPSTCHTGIDNTTVGKLEHDIAGWKPNSAFCTTCTKRRPALVSGWSFSNVNTDMGGALLGGNFKLAGQAQRFLSAHDQINNLFHLRRDHVTAAEHRATRSRSFHL